MPFRKRIKRQTRGKGHSQHSGTLIHGGGSLGPGSAPNAHTILKTEAGARSTVGNELTFSESRTTGDVCNIGDLCKFVNLFIQCGPRLDSNQIGQGWLEWTVVWGKESDIAIPITAMGTTFLGVVANRMFPTQVLLSGHFAIGRDQPNLQDIAIKIPQKFAFLKFGDILKLYVYFRTSNSTDTGVNNVKVISSFIYNAYQ